MKAHLLFLSLLTSVFSMQIKAQDRTIINATNSEISDNLDLKAVASIFGDSNNLQDFERRLNDSSLQISNLDLNNDNQVDYLRVIETMENQTHVIIIQDILARNTYQDVATIIVEKDNYNKVNVQIVGDSYLYGQNYIYEPLYYNTPSIFGSLWLSNYRPYYSAWNWNFYPSYYYAWNPFPVFRYRNNMRNSINSYNQYNYANSRRSSIAITLYNSSRRSNGYEKQFPDNAFSRRNSEINNRYELDQRRSVRNTDYRNETRYSQNRNEYQRTSAPQRTENIRDYSQYRTNSPTVNTQQNVQTQGNYSQTRTESPMANTQQNSQAQRDYSQARTESPRANTQPQRNNFQNRTETPKVVKQQSSEPIKEIYKAKEITSNSRDNSSTARNENRRQ